MVEDERGKEEVVLTKAEQRKMRQLELRNQELEAMTATIEDVAGWLCGEGNPRCTAQRDC